jgi:MoxR-like ATPase
MTTKVMSKVQAEIKNVEREMNDKFFERKDEVRGLLVGLVSRHHVLLLGDPGTGKSALTEELCSRINGSYFRWLMSRTSTPEELYGPISLKALENDSYRRVTTAKLPEAQIGFLDEIFKCNSAVLNSLLSILNERLFFNDGQAIKVPLQMVVGASNELPEDREELGALWDRFTLRYIPEYISDPRNFEAMLTGVSKVPTTTYIDQQDLTTAQTEASMVDVSRLIPQVLVLRQKMVEMNIPVSDRRWKQSLDLIKANAWLEGRTQASDEDLEILAHSLWVEPNQRLQIRQLIMSLANPLDQEALELLDQAMEIWQKAINAEEADSTAAGMEANKKLKNITKRLEELKGKAQKEGKGDGRITDALTQTMTWNKEVIGKCLGM